MTRPRTIALQCASLAAYTLGGFLTFGHAYNAGEAECRTRSNCYVPVIEAGGAAIVSGLTWPVYWLGLGAVVVTR